MLSLAVTANALALQPTLAAAPQQIRDGSVTVTVPRGATVRTVAEAILVKLGLSGSTLINFNIWIQKDFIVDVTEQLTRQGVAAELRQGTGSTISFKIIIKASLIDLLQRFGLRFAQSPAGEYTGLGGTQTATSAGTPMSDASVAGMSSIEKIAEAIRRSIPLLPESLRQEVSSLLEPETLAVIAAVIVIWAASHFVGVGEVADVILIVVGVVALGGVAVKAAGELIDFSIKAVYAKKDSDLDEAAKHFATAVSLIGVQAILALLFRGAPKTFNKPYFPPLSLKNQPIPPRTPGSIFYKPTIGPAPNLGPGVLGSTNKYGDIKYLSSLTGEAKRLTILHEKVHSFLTPKLQVFRNFRIVLRMNGYSKSFILRYLEEALAETISLVSIKGFREVFRGVAFPVKEGYIVVNPQGLTARQITSQSLKNLGTEAAGILLGTVTVSGMLMHVYFTYTRPSDEWQEQK